jgi:hypothetical protein
MRCGTQNGLICRYKTVARYGWTCTYASESTRTVTPVQISHRLPTEAHTPSSACAPAFRDSSNVRQGFWSMVASTCEPFPE